MAKDIHIVSHPLVQHKLTLMRQKETSTAKFRMLMREVSLLLGYEVTRNMPLSTQSIETPLTTMQAPILEAKKAALIPILRAGSGILDGMLQLLPTARVGHVGLYRQHGGEHVVEYYCKLPEDLSERDAMVLDPMLATGKSAIACVNRLKESKPKSITFVCLLASPEGIEALHNNHPDVAIYTAAVDEGLDANNYIVPGIGDAGDRLYGTQ